MNKNSVFNLVDDLLARPVLGCFAEADAGEEDGGAGGDEYQEETEAEAETEAVDPEDEEDDIEYEGKVYRGPKVLKDAVMRHGDYTNKTKEIAAFRERLESENAQREELHKLRDVLGDDVQSIKQIDVRLASFKDLDAQLKEWSQVTPAHWAQLHASDPAKFIAAQAEYNKVQEQRQERYELNQKKQESIQALQRKHGEITQRETTQRKQARDNAAAEVAKSVPGWNGEKAKIVEDFALKNGIPQQQIDVAFSFPQIVQLIHDAYLYRTAKSAATVTALVPKKPAAVPSVKVVGSTTTSNSKPSDKDAPDDYMRKRMAQKMAKVRGHIGRAQVR